MQKLGSVTITTPIDREIVITRDFNAARELVWQAMTKAEHIKRWMIGPGGWAMVICENEAAEGAAFHWLWRANEGGREMSLRGVYREVVPFERIVRTETFEFGCEAQSGEQLGTMTLAEQAGITTLTITILFPSKESRDEAIASGMAKGMSAGFDRLEEFLPTIA